MVYIRASIHMDQADDGCMRQVKRRLRIWRLVWGSFRCMSVTFRFYPYPTK